MKIKLKDILINEEIVLDISIGDTLLGGRFKNKKVVVKTIGKDENNQPTINGKKLLSWRILKQMPQKEITKEELIKLIDEKIKALLT